MDSKFKVGDPVQKRANSPELQGKVGVILEELSTISATLGFYVVVWSDNTITANSEYELNNIDEKGNKAESE